MQKKSGGGFDGGGWMLDTGYWILILDAG